MTAQYFIIIPCSLHRRALTHFEGPVDINRLYEKKFGFYACVCVSVLSFDLRTVKSSEI